MIRMPKSLPAARTLPRAVGDQVLDAFIAEDVPAQLQSGVA